MTDPEESTPRRGRRLWKAGCGCGAFALGGLVVAVIFLPSLAGGFVARSVEADFAARYEGRLELPAPSLAWRSRQRVEGVELFDPGGTRVFGGSLELPSIVELLGGLQAVEGGGPIRLGSFRLELEGELRVDEDGRSNLEAALAERAGSSGSATGGSGAGGGSGDELDVLQRLELELELVSRELRYSDPRLDVRGNSAALLDVGGRFKLSAGTLNFSLAGEQECETRGKFAVELEAGGFARVDGELQPESLRVELSAGELSAALVDRLAKADGEFSALFGERFDFEARLDGQPSEQGAWRAELRSSASRLALAGTLSDERFELTPGAAVLELAPEVAAERVRAWSARALPAGTRVELPDERLEVSLRELEFGIDTGPEAAESLVLHAAFELGAFTLVDPLANGGGERLALDGLQFSLDIEPGKPLRSRIATGFSEAVDSRLELELELDVGWSTAAAQGRDEDISGTLRLSADQLPVDRARKLAVLEDRLEDLVGGRLALEGSARFGAGELQRLKFEGQSRASSFGLDAAFTDGRLVLAPDESFVAARLDKSTFAELVREALPAGSVLSSRESELALRLDVRRLELDLARLEGERPLEGALIGLRVTTGAVDYTDGVLAPVGAQVALRSSETQLGLDESGVLDLRLDAALNSDASGRLTFAVSSVDGEAWLTGDVPADARLALDGSLLGFPTRVLDLYAEQDGLLVDVLGPRVDATLKSTGFGTRGGPLNLRADSRLGYFSWRGRYRIDEQGAATLVSGEGGELLAKVGLSPLLNKRIVGPLVPLLVNLKKPGAEPLGISARDVRLPLAGGLRGLDAKLRLDLGEVSASFLPALLREVPGLAQRAAGKTTIAPIEMQIVKGVVHYDRLPITVDGRPLDLAGTYDLVTRALDLDTEVRLGDLGGSAGKLLKTARQTLGDDYRVPIHVGGISSRPKVGLKAGFAEEMIEKYGKQRIEDELLKGLRGLFGD